ncbi:MAG: immunoglobulin domain-containing protein [Lachnospiraceae bacterium]|nr:immunoglobulin domain-containing protein [Lachnospiraceae bacterium]
MKTKLFKKCISSMLAVAMVVTGVNVAPKATTAASKADSLKKQAGVNVEYSYTAIYNEDGDRTAYISCPRDASGSVGETLTIPVRIVDGENQSKIISTGDGISVKWSKRAVGTNGKPVEDEESGNYIYQPIAGDSAVLSYTLLAADFDDDDEAVIKAEITYGDTSTTEYITVEKLLPFSTDDSSLNFYYLMDSRNQTIESNYSYNTFKDGKLRFYAPKLAKSGYTFKYSWSYITGRKDSSGESVENLLDGETGDSLTVYEDKDYDTVVTEDEPNNAYDIDNSNPFKCSIEVSYNGVAIDSYTLTYYAHKENSFKVITYKTEKEEKCVKVGDSVTFDVGKVEYNTDLYDISYRWYKTAVDDNGTVGFAPLTITDDYIVNDGTLTIKAVKEDMIDEGNKTTTYYAVMYLVPKGEKGNPKYDPALGECDAQYSSAVLDKNGNETYISYGRVTSSVNFTISFTDEYNFYTYYKENTINKSVGDSATFTAYGYSNSGKNIIAKWYNADDYIDGRLSETIDENGTITDFMYKDEDDNEIAELQKNTTGTTEWSYTIDSIKVEDFHEYYVVICDGKNYSVQRFELNSADIDNAMIYGITPESNYVKASIGQSIDLKVEVKVDEKYPVSYLWYKKNSQSGLYEELSSTTNTQNITVKDEFDYTHYYCTVSNGIDETVFQFYVYTDDFNVIRASNYYNYASPGDKVSFKVQAMGDTSSHELIYEWSYAGQIISKDNSPTYTIDSLDKDAYGYYECNVTDVTTGDEDSIEFLVLKYSKVKFSAESDTSFTIAEGGSATFKASVENPENLTLEYKWFFDSDYDSYDNVSNSDYVLLSDSPNALSYTVSGIDSSKYGRYILVAYNENQQVGSSLNFYINEPDETTPRITIKPNVATTQTVKLGGKATFSVTATSNLGHALRYQWYYDGVAIAGATGSSYTIESTTLSDYTDYSVMVVDTVTEDEYMTTGKDNIEKDEYFFYLNYTTKLSVETNSPYNDYVQVKSVQGTANKAVTLNVSVTATDSEYPETYQWYYTGDRCIYDSDDYPNALLATYYSGLREYVIPGAESKSYKISALTKDKVGYYACVVSNAFDKYVVVYYVFADTGLKVSPVKRVYSANLGKSATLKANVSFNKGYTPTYKWYYDGKLITDTTNYSGINTKNLTVKNITESSFGDYTLKVDNGYESASVDFELERAKTVGVIAVKSQTGATLPNSKVKATATVKVPSSKLYTVKYKWYVVDPNTGDYVTATTYKKVKNKYKKFNGNAKSAYIVIPKFKKALLNQGSAAVAQTSFMCVMTIYNKSDGSLAAIDDNGYVLDGEDGETSDVLYIVNPTYKKTKPQSKHKYAKSTSDTIYTVAGYKTTKKKAKKLVFKFDKKTSLDKSDVYHRDSLYIINQNGIATEYLGNELKGKSVTLAGKKAAFLLISNSNETGAATAYGYKVKTVKIKKK